MCDAPSLPHVSAQRVHLDPRMATKEAENRRREYEENMDSELEETREEYLSLYPDFTEALQKRRQEVIDRSTSERLNVDQQVMDSPGDVGDASVADESTDYYLQLADRDRRELLEIQDALDRMRRGVFGVCENCESQIALGRLKRLPTARFCIDCQNSFEKGAKTAKIHPFPTL